MSASYFATFLVFAFIAVQRSNSQGLFPALTDLAADRPITSTSTCGTPAANSYCNFDTNFDLSYDSCRTTVCNDTCPYGDSLPANVDTMNGATLGAGVRLSSRRPSSPQSIAHAYFFNGSKVSYALPSSSLGPFQSDPGFTFAAWIFPLRSSQGVIISKTSSDGKTRFYTWRVLTTSLSLDYRPVGVQSGYRTATLPTTAVINNRWSHVVVTVYEANAAFFVNGGFIGTVALQDSIQDGTGNTVVGQITKGVISFYGQLQEVYIFNSALSERSVQELYSSNLPALPIFSSCRCPPSHPRVDSTNHFDCVVFPGQTSSLSVSRLNSDAHPVNYINDVNPLTRWQSYPGRKEVNITINLGYTVEVPYMIAQFYTPRPKAMIYEKSLDGVNYSPLQYFADDCQSYFGLSNNGLLATSTAVNCLTSYSQQIPTSQGQVAFRFQDQTRPQAATYDNSPSLRQAVLASYVRLRMIDYFTNKATNEHLFYGIITARVLGRCECNGHSSQCTESGVCVCQHHTTGNQCDQCDPLYNNKPWTHGTTTEANPCVQCECNEHATSCHYDASIDSSPSSRTASGGGTCENCLDNTEGVNCERCVANFYRPSGRALNASDVCKQCDCHLPGVVAGDEDCVKDDSTPGVLAGQCTCKSFVAGRRCDACLSSFFNLQSVQSGGCEACGCNADGTVGGAAASCHQTTGQCPCKANVMGVKCDQCVPGTHTLSPSNSDGCSPCACHAQGAVAGVDCDTATGQCQCKSGTTAVACDRCAAGFFNLTSSGCRSCGCDSVGSANAVCDAVTGQCPCKANVDRRTCDECKVGFYDLASGCVACSCDVNGTAAGSSGCSADGNCTCKAHVTGSKCDACIAGYFGLSASDVDGCRPCSCSAKGTTSGGNAICDAVSGQCPCLSNVAGRTCDTCVNGFYLTPNNQTGCLSCNCHPQGSRDSGCHQLTGQCSCLTGVGIGRRACDGCDNGFFQFTGTSCTACQCNATGSAGPDCHQTTGVCTCKQYVEGDKCDRCTAGFTGLSANNPFGCSAAPEEQGPPTLTALNGSAVRIDWNVPEKPNGIVIEYQVIRNSTVAFRGLALSHVDTGLLANSIYTYKIKATTAGGSTESVSLTVKTLQGPPGGVSPPILSVISATNLIATWSQPAMPNGVITKFELVDVATRVVLFSGLRRSFSILGLSPFTTYRFSIRACTTIGCTDSSPTSAATLEAAPSFQPAPVLLGIAQPDRLMIGWSAPSQPNGALNKYVLHRRDSPFVGSGQIIFTTTDVNVNETIVTALQPFTNYEFAVESSTAGGSTRSLFARVKTGESVPQGVLPPTAVTESSSVIRLSWLEPGTPNGIISLYRLYEGNSVLHQSTQAGQFRVTTLNPFTEYEFFVEVCTNAGCANSSTAKNRTFDAPPAGQFPPILSSPVTASSASFNWAEPSVKNGKITSYNLERKTAAFSPQSVVAGRYFEGNGYVALADNIFYGGFQSSITISFKTHNPDGLLAYSGDSAQTDFVAIQLTAGRPYFIFNCGSGAGVVQLSGSSKLNDGQWHKLVASRRGNTGTLTLDESLSGSGSSAGSATVIGSNTGFFIGGVSTPFRSPSPGHTASFPVTTTGFAGGIRDVSFGSQGTPDLSQAMSFRNVRSADDGVPLLTEAGMHFKGGGYVTIDEPLGRNSIEVSFRLRTEQKNGILVFAYSRSGVDFLAIQLSGGEIRLAFDNGGGMAQTTTDSSRAGLSVCDGNWHTVRITKRDLGGEVFVDGFAVVASVNVPGPDTNLDSTSYIYVGGVDEMAATKAEELGVATNHFGGCIQNLTIGGNQVTGVRDLQLVSLAGCPGAGQPSSSACLGGVPSTITSGLALKANDSTLQAFTEYLYRVRTSNRGGSTVSSWISVHSREAAPSGVPRPTLLYRSGEVVSVSWTYPSQSNGVILQYRLLFHSYHPQSSLGSSPTTAPTLATSIVSSSALQYTMSGLNPYTTYRVVLEASTSAGSSQGLAATFTTNEAKPVGVPVPNVVVSSRSLNFTWDEPAQPNGVIILYELHANGHSLYENTDRHFLLTQLTPFVTYAVELFACTSAGCTVSPQLNIATAEDLPEGVPAPKLVAQGAQTVLATWNEPKAKNGIITRYELHLVTGPSSSRVVFTGTVRQATVQGLVAGANYSFFVNASTSVGGTTGPSASVITLDDVPEGVSPPSVIAASATITLAKWTAPTKPNGVITEYRLLEDEVEVFRGLDFAYNSTSLKPYTVYNYKVQACTSKGCGSSVPFAVRTLEAPPIGQPLPNVTVVNSTSVSVVFGEPAAANGVIQYRLFARGEVLLSERNFLAEVQTFVAFKGTSGVDPAVVGNLLPFSNYTFWVEVSNGAGSTNSSTATVTTDPDAPYDVLPPSVVVLGSTSIKATWQVPGRVNGILQRYTILVREQESGRLEVKPLVSVDAGLALEATVPGLDPFTTYNVTLTATSSGGATTSRPTSVSTSESEPVGFDRPSATTISARFIVIVWDLPSSPNGVITSYRVLANGRSVATTVDDLKANITNLSPFTLYSMEVEACNSAGCTISDELNVTTSVDVAEGISVPSLSSVTARSVVVQWQQPDFPNGIVLAYYVQRQQQTSNTTVDVAKLQPSTFRYLDDSNDLKPHTTYLYRIKVENLAGNGTGSFSNVTTKQAAPQSVSPPTTSTRSSTTINVEWKEPVQPNGVITSYELTRIEVLTNQIVRRQFSGDRTATTATGLSPYTNYSFILAACTIAGCTESPTVFALTSEALATGLSSPKVNSIVDSSTSLFVFWTAPTESNGALIRYELKRRNLDELPSAFEQVLLANNQTTSIVDNGLDVYHRYEYTIAFVNGAGATVSKPSSTPVRTNADVPLAGPTVTATVVNHTSIRVSWTPPVLKLLRGPVVGYTLYYKRKSLQVNATEMFVRLETTKLLNNLQPNTDYEFTVSVNNGIGTAVSDAVIAKTLDGAPEGVKKPTIRVLSSSEVEVTWFEPTMSNGRILSYSIYRGSVRVHNATKTSSFIDDELEAFTTYSFTVEVCTVFDCVVSDGTTATTLEATPVGMAAPTVVTLGARSVNVSWVLPQKPNGAILSYEVHRVPYLPCSEVLPTEDPSATPTKEQCTYVKCPLLTHSQCGTACYDSTTETCCDGTVHKIQSGFTCCGTNYTTLGSPSDVCCGGQFHALKSSFACCDGKYVDTPSGSVCCDGTVSKGDACCTGVAYDSNSQLCCGGLVRTAHVNVKCCGDSIVLKSKVCCSGSAYDQDVAKVCCGSQYVANDTTLCCTSVTGAAKGYAYISPTAKQSLTDACCGTVRIKKTEACCNEQGYDPKTHVCADRSTLVGSSQMCGSGTICPVAGAARAYCDQCDFDVNAQGCGTVDGKFAVATSVPSTGASPTAGPQLCAAESRVVFTGFSLYAVDSELEPFTQYRYTVVAFNNIGNATSVASSITTDQAAPEGVSAPSLKAVSSSEIEVKWIVPLQPNGIIQRYTLYRLGVIVHRSFDFKFDDSGLDPFTSYAYTLEVCTAARCTNSSASSVLTQEDAPAGVSAPIATALSPYVVHLSLPPPLKPNGVILKYNLYVNGNVTATLSGSTAKFNVTSLKPFTLYSFEVEPCTNIDCTRSARATVRTLEAAPEEVLPPKLTILSATSVDVQWTAPATPNGIVLPYVLLRNGQLIYNGTDLSFTDKGLTPSTTYDYQVTATTGGGSTTSDNATIQTPEDTPEGLAKPQLTAINSTAIRADWFAPAQPNGQLISYSLYVDGHVRNASLQTSLIVGGFEAFTRHEFQVESCNSKGCARSQRAEATTQEAPPLGLSPPVLVSLGPAAIQVSWSAPLKPNGILTRYEVYRKATTAGAIEFLVHSDNSSILSFINVAASQLKPFTHYEYRVRAKNNAGSVYSDYSTVRTAEDVPLGINAPTVTVDGASVVNISWSPPSEPNGIIQHYVIRYRRFLLTGNLPVIGANVSGTELTARVTALDANTDYEFQVIAYNNAGFVESSFQLATTEEGCPEQLQLISAVQKPDGTQLTLSWNAPLKPNGIVRSYRLFADTVYIISGQSFVYNRLTPFTAYLVQLAACTDACCTRGQNQTVRTAEVPPTGQDAPVVTSLSQSEVEVAWKEPSSPNGIITAYEIYRRLFSDTPGSQIGAPVLAALFNTTNGSLIYVDGNLSAFTRYQYSVASVNSVGRTQSPYVEVQTSQAAPQGVFPPSVIIISSTSASLSWQEPSRPNGLISQYTLRRNGSQAHNTLTTEYTDIGLKPYTVYSYSIEACTIGGCSESVASINTTFEAAPAFVAAPNLLTFNATAIHVNWTVPGQPNGIIAEYLIEYTGFSRRSVGVARQYLAAQLAPFSFYDFYLTACTSGGCTTSAKATGQSGPAAPEGLSAPRLQIQGSETIFISWTKPSVSNGNIDTYRLTRNGSAVYNGKDLSFKDGGLIPGSTYAYQYSVSTIGGGSTTSSVSTGRTNPDAPAGLLAPTSTPLSATSVHVAWQSPVRPNGVIVSYVVILDGARVFNGTAANFSFVVTGLAPFTTYAFQIEACTQRGCSISDETAAKTSEAPPAGQNGPSLVAAARNVTVTWSPPDVANGVITGYELRRRLLGDGSWQLIYAGTVTSFFDNSTSLRPYTRYEYNVTAFNSVGSASGPPTPIRLEEAEPEGISLVNISNVGPYSFVVVVPTPSFANGIIIRYQVAVNGTIVASDVQSSLTVTGLIPFTVFAVTGEVCTTAGCGSSAPLVIVTAEAQPEGQTKPTTGVVTSSSVALTWEEPDEPNGKITMYRILKRTSCPQPTQPFVNSSLCVEGGEEFVFAVTGSSLSFTAISLNPYTTYQFRLTAINSAGSALSPWSDPVTTLTDRPRYTGVAPVATSSDTEITIDWSRSFEYNSEVRFFLLYENNMIVFQGPRLLKYTRLGVQARQTYTYHVNIETEEGTASSSQVDIIPIGPTASRPATKKIATVSVPASLATPRTGGQTGSAFYGSVGFIIGITVAVIVILFIIAAVCMRRSAPSEEQRRKRQRAHAPRLSSAGYWAPQPLRGPSPAQSETKLMESPSSKYHRTLEEWTEEVSPSESAYEDHKPVIDSSSGHFNDVFIGEHTTFSDTHL
eukprot:m.23504 g.23504  ORF g.23504 m.23504 type:complete len:5054 (+) comp28492_c0_seq1:2267-17428(+)